MSETACRGCGAAGLDVVLDLGKMPLANALLREDQLQDLEPVYPLELAFCSACSLAQITECVEPETLFGEYTYFSSYSTTMLDHAERLVTRLIPERELGPASLAVELASNDGYLLQFYARAGVPVLGIDPARNVAEAAEERGVPTLVAFFDQNVAADLRSKGRAARVIHANNVIAHVADLNGFVSGIATLLSDDGVAVIETPYVRELVDRVEFDTIYHEHLYYYSLTSMARVLERASLKVTNVERLRIHGGSLRVFAEHAGSSTQPDPTVAGLLQEEERLGIAQLAYFRDLAGHVEALGPALRKFLSERKSEGRSIAAYGAAAKGAVLLNAFGIGAETLDFVADRSPHKQGLFMPGVRVPISGPERILEEMPDDVLLLAWNFAEEILEQQDEYRRRGGSFIVPVPEPRVM